MLELGLEMLVIPFSAKSDAHRSGPGFGRLGCHPDIHRRDEPAMRRRAYVDPLGGDPLAAGQRERCPGFGHAAEGHFLDRCAGGAVHDGGDDTHAGSLAMDAAECQLPEREDMLALSASRR